MTTKKTFVLSDALYEYTVRTSLRENELLRRLREETQAMPQARMQIGPDQGQFMALLAKLVGARRALEVGVFTGYSTLCVALALPDDGSLVACDVSEEYTQIARRYWNEAGVGSKIDLHLRPALDTLRELLTSGQAETFDFAFIDADKTNYDAYYESALRLLRPGGLIALDNVFWGGAVADPADQEEDTLALRAINEKIGRDTRVDMSMVPVGDGLTLARKRP